MEASETGTRVHYIMQKHPFLRVKYIFKREIRAVTFIDGSHYLLCDTGKSVFSAEVVIYDSRRALSVRINDQFFHIFRIKTAYFGFVMVKRETHARIVRQVCCYIILGKLDLAVLYVFRMYEFYAVQYTELSQYHGAYQTVKITSCYQTLFFHISISLKYLFIILPHFF